MKISNLVLQGGGVGAIAYAGFINKATELGILNLAAINAIAGVSSGAIAAMQLALNYSSNEVFETLEQTDFSALVKEMQTCNTFDMYTEAGDYKTEPLYTYIENLIKRKTTNTQLTFADLAKQQFKELYVVATRLVRMNGGIQKQEVIFSPHHTPQTEIIAAVRASASLPVIFPPVRMKERKDGNFTISKVGDVYIDGGLVNNFPINLFNDQKDTLGLRLTINNNICHKTSSITSTFEYAAALFTLIKLGNTPQNYDAGNSIIIDTLGIPSTQFNLSDAQKSALVKSGEAAAIELKEKYDFNG